MFDRVVIIPHTTPIRPTAAIRSTMLQTSVGFLRERGHFDDYFAVVNPIYRELILESIAPTWLPIAVADAHYAACDALNLSAAEQLALGEAVGDRVQGTFLTTVMRSAKSSGMSPILLFKQFDKLFLRLFQGGSIQLTQTGPKDAELEIRGALLTRHKYFRRAFVGVVQAAIRFGGTRVEVVKEASFRANVDALTLVASWV
jgi:hypothetical protein